MVEVAAMRSELLVANGTRTFTISVDYLGGIGAPEYKAVVGGELERTENGSLYRIVRYESLGFWVSYNRTIGLMATVTVTIQKKM